MRAFWLFFAVMATVAMLVMGWQGCHAHKKLRGVRQVIKESVDSVQYWRDMWGREHASRMVVEGDRRTLEIFYKGKLDSARQELGLNKRQLKELTEIAAHVQGGGQGVVTPELVVIHDTVNGVVYVDTGRAFVYVDSMGSDTLAVITGEVGARVANVKYGVWVSLQKKEYWKRRWLLGRKRYYNDVTSRNPRVRVTGLEGIRIK